MTESTQAEVIEEEIQQEIEPESSSSEQEDSGKQIEFVKFLADFFDKDTLKTKYKLTLQGLFIEEKFLIETLEAFIKFNQGQSDSIKNCTVEKATEALFMRNSPVSVYIVEGSDVVPGFLIEFTPEKIGKTDLVSYKGRPLSTKNFLHPKDPLFAELGIQANSGKGGQEYLVERKFKEKSENVAFGAILLKDFSELISKAKNLQRQFPGIDASYRDVFKCLVHCIKNYKPQKKKYSLIVPIDFYPTRSTRYFRYGTFVFVVSADKKVEFVYELKGNNQNKFLNSEWQILVNKLKKGGRILFSIFPEKDKLLGFCKINDNRFTLSKRCFSEFLELAPRSFATKDKLGKIYDLKKAFRTFEKSFESSGWVTTEMLNLKDPTFVNSKLNYRVDDDLVYVVNTRGVIISCQAGLSRKKDSKKTDQPAESTD